MSYKIRFKCSNCDHIQERTTPKGTLADDFARKLKCSKCGCGGTLSKVSKFDAILG